MNKIFKVIWSKARNCYVVVSELAKSHDDGHVRRRRSGCCRKAAVLAAFVLTTSLSAVPVWAADGNGVWAADSNGVWAADSNGNIVIGGGKANAAGSIVIGNSEAIADTSQSVIMQKLMVLDKGLLSLVMVLWQIVMLQGILTMGHTFQQESF